MRKVIIVLLCTIILTVNTIPSYANNTNEKDVQKAQQLATNIILADRIVHELRMLNRTLQPLVDTYSQPNEEQLVRGEVQLRHYHEVSERVVRSNPDEYLMQYVLTDVLFTDGWTIFWFLLNDDFTLTIPQYIDTISTYVTSQYTVLLSYPYTTVMHGLLQACADVGELYYLTETTTIACN